MSAVASVKKSEVAAPVKVPMAWAATALAALCERIDNGEDPHAVAAEFASTELALADAVDRRIAMIRFVEGAIEGAKAARDAYAADAQRLTDLLTSMKDRTKDIVQANPDLPYSGTLGRFTVQKNGGHAPLKLTFGDREVSKTELDLFEVPERFVGSKVVFWIRTDEVRAALAAGEKLPWAELEERGHHLRIRA